MKKILAVVLLAFVAFGCGTPKTVKESKKVIKGYWNLTNISYSESGTYNVTLLNDTSKECFEGSTWRFIPNNNTGIYTVNNGNCPTGDRNFIFTIQEIDANTGLYDFLLKPTIKRGKPDDSIGFRLSLTQLTENSMRWEQTVSVDGSPFTIYMNFSKIEE
ncbi:MAG: lipocalin [Flavobacteriaceae bacterium]|nr:lipocalin [Flavobacteriaceae bacterium]|tara:strand:+ start:10879 stop:11358 length:480 start_codon:yes stop_codon:yes gene_type:complete